MDSYQVDAALKYEMSAAEGNDAYFGQNVSGTKLTYSYSAVFIVEGTKF